MVDHTMHVSGLGLIRLVLLLALSQGVNQRLQAQDFKLPQSTAVDQNPQTAPTETIQQYNLRLKQLELAMAADRALRFGTEDYRIGPDDLLEISVFEAPELNRTVRVSARGEISLSLLGAVQAAGLTPRELEFVLQEVLRRTYMKDPHVGVFVREMQSHPVSVFGAVKKPGVFQIRGAKTLVEVLSMAEGLAEDAGDTVVVMRGAGLPGAAGSVANALPPEVATAPQGKSDSLATAGPRATEEAAGGNAVEINLKNLVDSGDPRYNVMIYPGDVVKVARAGVVYVVGEVKKPGGFVLKTNENISVLQALALAEGLTRTSAKSRARIIRTDEATGARTEIPMNLHQVLAGRAADPLLRPKDIVFVPNSTGRSALYRGAEAAITIAGGVIIYRR